jgi:hypothetical protein
MELKLKEDRDRQLEMQKFKYEQQIDELKRNHKTDKEFITSEFEKKIADLQR